MRVFREVCSSRMHARAGARSAGAIFLAQSRHSFFVRALAQSTRGRRCTYCNPNSENPKRIQAATTARTAAAHATCSSGFAYNSGCESAWSHTPPVAHRRLATKVPLSNGYESLSAST